MSAAEKEKPKISDKAQLETVPRKRRKKPRHPPVHEDGESNWLVSYADMMTLLVGFFVLLQSVSKVDAKKYEQVKQASSKSFGGEYQEPYKELKDKIKKVIEQEKLTDKVSYAQTDEGLEVTFDGQLFFESGAVELNPEALNLLGKLVPPIREDAKNYYVTIEGHTDNRPIHAGVIASNWELSSLRATRVLRFLQEAGYDPHHLKSIGWGDIKPLAPNVDSAGREIPENQAKNRRVLVRISKNQSN